MCRDEQSGIAKRDRNVLHAEADPMKEIVQPAPVPATGPLILGAVYRRADLHSRFGGSRFSGIVPSKREGGVLLFHTEEPNQQFYRDGFDRDGIYWYSGEGVSGDMNWSHANRAIRDHAQSGWDLLFLERVQRKDGLWRFANTFYYSRLKVEDRPDKSGKSRSAIIFGLLPTSTTLSDLVETPPNLLNIPSIDNVQISEADKSLLVLQQPGNERSTKRSVRYSKNAAPVGRRAEEIAYRFIFQNAALLGGRNVQWVAKDGLTPGWDIQYENDEGELIAVEVEGTVGSEFTSIDLTAGEWNAASIHGDMYWLFLVANCCSCRPQIQRVQNPARLVRAGQAQVVPVVYRFSALVTA
jgi:hypothetical protein